MTFWRRSHGVSQPLLKQKYRIRISIEALPHPVPRAPGWPARRPCARGWRTSGQTYRPGSPSGPRLICTWQQRGSSLPRCWQCKDAAHAPHSVAQCDERDPELASPAAKKRGRKTKTKWLWHWVVLWIVGRWRQDKTSTERGFCWTKLETVNLSWLPSYLMRVPVTIKNDDCVSRLQVEPQATSSGTQQEHKVLKRRVIKVLKQHATVLSLSGSYIHRFKNYFIISIITG